jgi:hypothetical protein
MGFFGVFGDRLDDFKGKLEGPLHNPHESRLDLRGGKGDNPWIFQVSLNPEGNGDQGSFKNVTNDGNMFNNPVYGFERGHSKIEIKALVNKVDFP